MSKCTSCGAQITDDQHTAAGGLCPACGETDISQGSRCGHSCCSQNYIETGDASCIHAEAVAEGLVDDSHDVDPWAWSERVRSGVELRVIADAAPGSEDYSQAELDAAFRKVQNRDHWKGEIDWIGFPDADERLLITTAVRFFTATDARWVNLFPTDRTGRGRWHVLAPGYWAGPAN